jgi:hypothetical protein
MALNETETDLGTHIPRRHSPSTSPSSAPARPMNWTPSSTSTYVSAAEARSPPQRLADQEREDKVRSGDE